MTIVGHALLLVVANACLFVAGAGVARAFGIWRAPRELRGAIGISYMAGVASYGVVSQVLYVCGLALPLWQALLVCACLAATGVVVRPAVRAARTAGPPIGRLELAAIALAAIVLALLAFDALVQPLASWDAWTQWTAKAHALVTAGGLDPHVFGSHAYLNWHLDYPLLVPSLEAFAFRFIGIDYRVVHFQQWFLLFGFALAFVDLLRPRVRPLFVWAVLLAILWAPKVQSETIASNADIALAVFLGLAGIALYIWIVEFDRRALWLFGLFAAAALASKLEATYLVVAMSIATAVVVARPWPGRIRPTLIASVLALLTILPWRIWVAAHNLPATYSVHDALHGSGWHDPKRGPIATLVVLGQFFSPRGWLLLAPLSLAAVAALAVAATRSRQRLVVALSLAGFAAVGVGIAFAVPGPSFPYPWDGSDSLLFALTLVAGIPFVVGVLRARGLGAWTFGATALMLLTFVAAYIVTPYPFAWILGTSSARVVVGPELFLAALIPLLLERTARSPAAGRR
jgi:hypothetical protein